MCIMRRSKYLQGILILSSFCNFVLHLTNSLKQAEMWISGLYTLYKLRSRGDVLNFLMNRLYFTQYIVKSQNKNAFKQNPIDYLLVLKGVTLQVKNLVIFHNL